MILAHKIALDPHDVQETYTPQGSIRSFQLFNGWPNDGELLRPSIKSPITTTTLRQNGQRDFVKTAKP